MFAVTFVFQEAKPPTGHKWFSYYWIFCKRFGVECYQTWRQELLASVVVSVIAYGLTVKEDPTAWKNFKVALIATAITLGAFAIWHSLRSPWLVHSRMIAQEETKDHWFFGVLGICVMAGILTGGFSLSSYIWDIRATKVIIKIPAPPVPQITVAAPHQIFPRMQVEDSHGPVNGRVFYQDDAGNLNYPDPLSLRNIGSLPTQQLAVHVYFSEVVALSVRPFWESTGTGYDEFPFELWVRANLQLNPREKWNIPTLQGKRANIAWVKPITVKMEVFYGAPKPEVVTFRIEKRQ
jgi:hypothetical protein